MKKAIKYNLIFLFHFLFWKWRLKQAKSDKESEKIQSHLSIPILVLKTAPETNEVRQEKWENMISSFYFNFCFENRAWNRWSSSSHKRNVKRKFCRQQGTQKTSIRQSYHQFIYLTSGPFINLIFNHVCYQLLVTLSISA